MKCTIKDIAKELNLSRNTVAKALKGSSEVSPKTQELVHAKAKEMHYISHTEISPAGQKPANKGSILFLTRTYANDSEFWSSVLKGIEAILSAANYHLVLGIMSDTDLKTLQFPGSIYDPSIKGIIIVEICYESVCKALLQFPLPIVTVDMPKNYHDLMGKFDIITMENKINIYNITNQLLEKGAKRFGFIGDIYTSNVGRGFQERYDALNECLKEHNLKLDQKCCLLHETTDDFRNFGLVIEKIQQMSGLPDVFICGNDWLAIQLIYALQFLGYKVPRDVSVTGFDNIPASERIVPALTTISTPKEYLGIAAAKQIIERIDHPDAPCIFAQYATELIMRGSTI
ncbi:LacI family DNA-binding transcriptional regulator [uncultured Robinsoniella sp.]|uniref:LacI family DNA-binding transcriptional regulator n=1 Tax=uncultured Robinsoniella sp. TaxID=904190 RepID=UPI00374EBA6A